MSTQYTAVIWNREKKRYDRYLAGLIGLFLLAFCGLTLALQPEITAETLIIRATGTTALLLLHLTLMIGPLCRLDPAFLPLLYNRRHLGVTTFFFGLIHGVFNLIQFHSLGNVNPLVSLFTANVHYGSLSNFPFQVLGFGALVILFLMAATSHDFWLKNLGPKAWKTLHMFVYLAYGLLVMHVLLGVAQAEHSPVAIGFLGMGVVTVISLHLAAAFFGQRGQFTAAAGEDFVEVCGLADIEDKRAKVCLIGKENIAIFKYDGKLAAVSNICKHQHGPLGEGKIVDGCITCPWHGYQYLPENGCSPPPFTEKVSAYELKLVGDRIFVNPRPHPEGTRVEPVEIPRKHE